MKNHQTTNSLRLAVLVVAAAFISQAKSRADEGPKAWALLIGCERYEKARPLQFIQNDVNTLSDTLRTRCDFAAGGLLSLSDSSGPDLKPTKDNFERAVADFLKRPASGDRLIVYFSGHGFRDSAGKLYLAPLDCDPANPEATGVPVQWLRERIGACPAQFKLLLIDACHAGSERSAGSSSQLAVTSQEVGQQLHDLENVFTIAGSTADQPSRIWDDKEHSLFTYWLNQGLKGSADTNGDGAVSADELFEFTYDAVKRTSERKLGRLQTPVRIVRAGVEGVPVVARLQPQPLKSVLGDIADQLADKLTDRQVSSVGVLEFLTTSGNVELLGAQFGLLGSYCAEDLERKLIDLGEGRFSVVDRRRLQTALEERQFGLADLSSDTAMKQLSTAAGGMPVVVIGTLRGDDANPRIVHVQCKLTQTEGSANVGTVGGTAHLSESEWAMIGRSFELSASDRRVPRDNTPITDSVIRIADERSKEAHPYANPKFPYRVKVMVDNRERPGRLEGNDYVVPLRRGEVFELWIENRSRETVMARVLVDGLNTLAEIDDRSKGITQWITGKRVNLDEARFWILDPNAAGTTRINGVPTWLVEGFSTTGAEQTQVRKFTVVDASASLAARQQFTEQIGLITAAFYAPGVPGSERSASRGGIGVDAGEAVDRTILIDRSAAVGNLKVVVNIKYVEAE